MSIEDDLAALEHCRTILLRVTKDFTVRELDWLALPDSKSIGEILLHVAAFEYLIIAAASGNGKTRHEQDLWQSVKAGFAREAGFAPPRGLHLGDYLEIFGQVRQGTRAFLLANKTGCRVARGGVDIAEVTARLASADSGSPAGAYALLKQGVATSFRDDGAVRAGDSIDLAALLQLHETYHRGQITFQKYLHSKERARVGR